MAEWILAIRSIIALAAAALAMNTSSDSGAVTGGMPATLAPVRQGAADIRYRAHNSGARWAIAANGDELRFEVRPGDFWRGDGSAKERSELYYPQKFTLRQSFDLTYSLMIEPGPPNTASWLTLTQLMSTFDPLEPGHSPPFALELRGERMRVVSRDSAARMSSPANTNYRFHYQDAQPLSRGRWYAMRIQVRFDPGQGGLLKLWRDGRQLVDYRGPIGFEDLVGPYLKLGVYRDTGPRERFVVRFRDVRMGRAGGAA